jgi:hypothetical protein
MVTLSSAQLQAPDNEGRNDGVERQLNKPLLAERNPPCSYRGNLRRFGLVEFGDPGRGD